jgi:rubrerythrin
MNERLNKKRIYPIRAKEVSKGEADRFEGNRLSPEQIEKIKKLQEEWELTHSWKCKCGKLNKETDFECPCCGAKKPSKV